jgi:cytochrome c-type biogenesis protein CcsB
MVDMAEWEIPLLSGAFAAYFAASCLYIAYVAWQRSLPGKLANLSAIAGWAANTLALVSRAVRTQHAPVANMYEFGMAFVWGMMLFYFLLDYRRRWKALGLFVLPLAFLLTGGFACFYQEARPLVPVLKSNWLLAHVATAVIAYGALAVSFALACTYFWRLWLEEKGDDGPIACALPSLDTLDEMANGAIIFALPFLTMLIITGAVWAEYAWGSYWRWDPKETWSLITWLIYAIYFHGRVALGWHGKKAMQWAGVGFIAVLFTFVGVNVLLPGLHSYAR